MTPPPMPPPMPPPNWRQLRNTIDAVTDQLTAVSATLHPAGSPADTAVELIKLGPLVSALGHTLRSLRPEMEIPPW